MEGWGVGELEGWRVGELEFGLSGGVRCWLRSLKTALKALCFQLKHPSRITHTKTYLQPAKSGACYLQRAYKSHLAASGYGISLTHTHAHTQTHTLLSHLCTPFSPLPPRSLSSSCSSSLVMCQIKKNKTKQKKSE